MTGMRGLVGCVYELRTGLGPLSLSVQRYSLLPAGQVRHTHLTFLTTGSQNARTTADGLRLVEGVTGDK